MYFLVATAVSLIAVVLIVSLPSMAQAQQELNSIKAEPQHHEVMFENDQVRVVQYLIKPGEKTPKHSHPNRVNILFTDAKAKITTEDGTCTNFQGKAGSAAWLPATTYIYENIGDKPIEGVLVEPKTPHSARPQGSADETIVPGTKVVFENDQVRVVNYRVESGQKTAMHGHPDHVLIARTDAKANVTTPDGTTTVSEIKAGQVRWRSALQHAVQNTGDKPFEGILVEMKGTPAAASN